MSFTVKVLIGISELRVDKLTPVSLEVEVADIGLRCEVAAGAKHRIAPQTLQHALQTGRVKVVRRIRERVLVEVESAELSERIRLEIPPRRRVIGPVEVVKRSARRFRAAPVEISAVRVGA
jgi:hypothetical protein